MSTERKTRGILFTGAMVRAIADGRKTQTRRVVKPQPNAGPRGQMVDLGGAWGLLDGDLSGEWRCPYGAPGDLLYVRETWAGVMPGGNFDEIDVAPSSWPHMWRSPDFCRYQADPDPLSDASPEVRGFRWRPSIHMPQWAARYWLKITDVRGERVQDISEDDARAEGCVLEFTDGSTLADGPDGRNWDFRLAFEELWDSINGPRGYGWDTNPWVWAITFQPTEVP